jgi:hypothetical protein
MSEIVSSVTKMSKSYEKMANKNKNIRLAVLGLLIVFSVLVVPSLALENLEVLDNTPLRVVIIVVISLVCLVDPVVSIMGAIAFVVVLNRLNVLKSASVNNTVLPTVPFVPEPTVEQVPEEVELELSNVSENENVEVQNNNVSGVRNNGIQSNPLDDGLINDDDLDVNNNVVNNNIVNLINSENQKANNVVNNALPNNLVNNALPNNLVNNALPNNLVNNALPNNLVNNAIVNNAVVNNTLLNNSAAVNVVNPNNLNDLQDNMNVLTNKDNLGANIVTVNDRNARRTNNNISGYNHNELEDKNRIGSNLLMNGTNYQLNNSNKLNGEFDNSVIAHDVTDYQNEMFAPVNDLNNSVRNNVNNNKVKLNNNLNIQGFNNNNLLNKNPFPGQNVNFNVQPQQAELNVDPYNSIALQQLSLNNSNNVKENLVVINNNNQENFEDYNNKNQASNNITNIGPLNNLVANNNGSTNSVNDVLNNVPQQIVGENSELSIQQIVKEETNNVNTNTPYSLLFTSVDQLHNAQDRSVYCDGKKNNDPILMNNDAHSAQGYNLPGDINGFNQYGSDAINYLCVSENC